jgi:hypothetical protein
VNLKTKNNQNEKREKSDKPSNRQKSSNSKKTKIPQTQKMAQNDTYIICSISKLRTAGMKHVKILKYHKIATHQNVKKSHKAQMAKNANNCKSLI